MWGKYPQVVTANNTVQLPMNFLRGMDLAAGGDGGGSSRSELRDMEGDDSMDSDVVDSDSMTFSMKLTLVSPAIFGGSGVQFLVGPLAPVGSALVWMGPANRLSENFLKSRPHLGFVENGSSSQKEGGRGKLVEE